MENKKRSFVGLAVAAVLLVAKSTKIIAALKLFKFSKPLVVLVSLLISALVYGFFLGPWFAIGFLVMLFIHEMGHVAAMRLKGMETAGPVFIPFLGAAIFVPPFKDRETEAFVGYGGPLLGTAAALCCFGLWFATGQTSEILLLVSFTGMYLNLFNLIPISPLDGGRITQAVGGWFKWVGLAALLVFTFMVRQPSLMLIWILVLADMENFFPLWVRPSLTSLLGVSMVALIIMGMSGQPWYVDVIDCMLVFLFVGAAWSIDFFRNSASKRGLRSAATIERINANLEELSLALQDAQVLKNEKLVALIKEQQQALKDELAELQGIHKHSENFPFPGPESEVRPYASPANRFKWLVAYVGLAAIAITAMLFQVPHLPEAVHKDSENLVAPAQESDPVQEGPQGGVPGG